MEKGVIRELKRGSGQKIMRFLSPAKLWDHCIELEALILSHRALDIYELQGQVPETPLSGKTSVRSWFRQNRYAQVFVTAFGWCRVYPMKKKRDAHHGLSLMAA